MHLTFGQLPTIVVSSPEIAKEMLKHNDPNYANRPETIVFEIMWYDLPDISFSLYGEYGVQMRKLCISELLSAKNVRSFGSNRKDEVSRVVESICLSSGKPVNFTEKVFSMNNSITCRAVCGKVCEDRDAVIKLMQDGFRIKAVLLDMFSAGTETLSSTIDWAMAELIRNPRVIEKAQAGVRKSFWGAKVIEEHDVQKLKYLKLVIKESLRMHPPVPILPRVSRDERIINGYTIPAKTRVLVNNWAMQRDPKYWKNPEVFEPERFESHDPDFVGGDFKYMSFGAGKRMCPGMSFGLANVELPLSQLLYSFDWKLPNDVKAEHLDMIETHRVTASRKDYLFVVRTSRSLERTFQPTPTLIIRLKFYYNVILFNLILSSKSVDIP